MTIYKARLNESPSMIARRFRVPMSDLIAANPHKQTTRVNGVTTWRGLHHNESVRLPAGAVGTLGDFIGDAATDAANALAAVNPCDAANVALVCAFQRAIGYTGLYVDGKYGAQLAAEVKKRAGHAPAGCSPRPSWWTPAGQSNCVPGTAAPAPAPSAAATPTAPPSGLTAAAAAAVAALRSDPNYCVSVARSGTPVNSGVHNFKAAWNSANPARPVPINTGNYESAVASALSETLGGATVPPGCGAPAPAPPPAPPGPPSAASVTPVATGGYSATQIAAATAMNAALSAHGYKVSDQPLYSAFQSSVGLKGDGFPGTGTMSKLSAVLSSAGIPMAPVKVYPWRAGAYDGVNAPTQAEWAGAPAKPSQTAQAAAQTAQTAATAAENATTAGAATAAATAAAAAATTAAAAAQVAAPADKPAADAAAATAATAAQAANTAAQAAGGGSAITPPEAKKPLSTGAIVAGAVGVAALVGIAAMALGGKKGGGHRRASGGGHRKPSKHKRKHGAKRKKK